MNVRIGEAHWRAKLTDNDVELIRGLLAERRALVASLVATGASGPPGQSGRQPVDKLLRDAGLSFRCIAAKMDVSRSLVRFIWTGQRRP